MPNLDRIMQLAEKSKATGTTQSNSSKQAQVVVNNGVGRVNLPMGTDTSKLTKETIQQALPTGVVPLSQRVKQSGASSTALPTKQAQGTGAEWQRQTLDNLMRGGQTLPYNTGPTKNANANALLYGTERAAASLLGFGEGITDFLGGGFYKGLQGLTSLGGILPNKVSDYAGKLAQGFVDNSVTRDYEESIKERYNPTEMQETATGIGQSVTQMLAGIATGQAGGAAAGALSGASIALDATKKAQQAANIGKVAFGLSAAGSGAREAYEEGATTGQALAYGAAVGTLEALIESAFGGIPGLGKGKVSQIVNKVVSNPAVGKLLDTAGEGVEEAATSFIAPFIKRAIYDTDAELASADEIAQSAILGMVTSGIIQTGIDLPQAIGNRLGNRVNLPRATSSVTADGGATFPRGEGLGADATPSATQVKAEIEAQIRAEDAAGAAIGIFDSTKGTAVNPATKEDISSYVDYALYYSDEKLRNPNADIPKQNENLVYGTADDRLVNDIKSVYGVDLSGKLHVLGDNDIRHINNSHGARNQTEKYPVTVEDLKAIPDIVTGYDDVLYVPRKDGKSGIFYVKRHNGTTYYLEQIRKGNILQNKQMIKTSTGTIPKVEGLYEAIDKKWNIDSAPNDPKIPRMYVQDVWNDVPADSIPQDGGDVNGETVAQEVDEHMQALDAEQPAQTVLHDVYWYEAVAQARDAGKRLGVQVVTTRDLPMGVDGEYRNGVIYISEYAENPLKRTFVHELTHHLEATNTYGELQTYALERAAEALSKTIGIDAYRQKIRDAYAKKGRIIDDAGVDAEITAKYVEQNLFNNSKEIARLTNKRRSLVQVIRDWFEDLRVKFRGTEDAKELLQAQRLFEQALRETNAKGYQTSGDGRYAVNPNFRNAYRAWATQYPNSNVTFSVGTTSKALQEIGVNEKAITWDAKKIRETKQKHPEITDAVIEQVPNLLEEPIIVMHSKDPQHPSRITMFGEIYGTNGLPVMAVVELLPTDRAGNYSLDEIKIASTYTKTGNTNVHNMQSTQNMINSSTILYVEPDKNKTNRWLSTTGLRLPFAASYGLNQTLAQIGVNVNPQFSVSVDGDEDILRASSGRTAEEVRADTKAAVEQYSAMDPHRQPGVREATYPHETAQGKTMRTPQNVGGSNLVDDWLELDIEEAILTGKFAYEVSGDKDALRDADQKIEGGRYEELAQQAKGMFESGYRLKKENVVFVERMIQEASKRGDVDTAMSLITDLAAYGTEQGQNIQALSMIRRMTPEGKLMVLKRQVEKANRMTQLEGESKGAIKDAEREIKKVKKAAYEGLDEIGVDESMDIEIAQKVVDEALADETAKTAQSGLPTAKKQKLQNKKQELTEAGKRVRELEKAIKKLRNPVTLSKETQAALLAAKAPSEQNEIYNRALDEIAAQIVSSLPDKINAWRYLAMLGNTRTHIRNLTGNTTMWMTNAAKNIVKRGMEVLPKAPKTTVLKASADAKAFAKEDFEKNRDLITGGGKQNASDELRDRMTVFNFKPLEKLRKLNTDLMKREDTFFMRHTYESALARYITANKKTKAFLESGSTASEEFLQKARKYAMREAQEVTFHDDSAIADWLSGITRSSKDDNLGVKAAKAMIEGILPFKKTPINVAKRGIEYSPLSVATAINKFSKGDAAGAVNDLAKGTTGTIMMALGLILARYGLLRTKNEDKTDVLDTVENEQNYSLRIPHDDGTVTSISLDALMPAAMPLLVGVEVNKLLEEEGASVMGVLESLTGIADPIVENSMLDGLNDMLSYIGYSDNALGAIATDMGENYLEQFRPSIVRQLAQTIDPTVRTTYSPKDSPIGKTAETHLRSLASVLPWGTAASEKIDEAAGTDRFAIQPKIDVWGNEVERSDNVALRALQNLALPFNVKKVDKNPVNDELRRLYHVDSTYSVLPKSADKSYTYKNETYYAEPAEYAQLAKTKGQTAKASLETAMQTSEYKALPDAKKADVVENLLKYANYVAKQEFFDGRGIDYQSDTFASLEKALDRGMTAEEYYIMYAQMDGGETAKERIPYYMDMLTSDQKNFVSSLPEGVASASWLERIALYNQGVNAKDTSVYDDLLVANRKEKVDYSDETSVYLSLIDNGANSKVGDKYYEYAEPKGISAEDYMIAYFAQKNVTYAAKTKGAKAAAEQAAIDKAVPHLSKAEREALYEAFKG